VTWRVSAVERGRSGRRTDKAAIGGGRKIVVENVKVGFERGGWILIWIYLFGGRGERKWRRGQKTKRKKGYAMI